MSACMTWAERHAAGSTLKRIAADNGVSRNRVKAAILAQGGTIRIGGVPGVGRRRTTAWWSEAEILRAEGKRFKEIAAIVFRSPETVETVLQRLRRGL